MALKEEMSEQLILCENEFASVGKFFSILPFVSVYLPLYASIIMPICLFVLFTSGPVCENTHLIKGINLSIPLSLFPHLNFSQYKLHYTAVIVATC